MNKNLKLAFASGIAALVVASPIAFADSQGGLSVKADGDASEHSGLQLGLGGLAKFFSAPHESATADIHANENAAFKTDGDKNKGDDNDRDDNASSTHAKSDENRDSGNRVDIGALIRAKLASFLSIGTVTGTSSSGFTIDPIGDKSTTTVTTNSSTVFVGKHGATTTSADLAAGTRVLVIGTTTATSSTGDSITAELVKIIGNIGKGLKHLFGLGD